METYLGRILPLVMVMARIGETLQKRRAKADRIEIRQTARSLSTSSGERGRRQRPGRHHVRVRGARVAAGLFAHGVFYEPTVPLLGLRLRRTQLDVRRGPGRWSPASRSRSRS